MRPPESRREWPSPIPMGIGCLAGIARVCVAYTRLRLQGDSGRGGAGQAKKSPASGASGASKEKPRAGRGFVLTYYWHEHEHN